jgi:DNA-binding GntR family transcriptional regulator
MTSTLVDAVHGLPRELFFDMERSGPIPLHFQVSSRIEAAIKDGRIGAGIRIENEVALGERLGLSRTTVRRALHDLVEKGLLVRRRGIGTQVVQPQVTRNLELTSLHEDLIRTDQSPGSALILFEVVPADSKVSTHLDLPIGSPVLHLRRIRTADGAPICILENFLVEEFSDINPDELLEHGLYRTLGGRGVTMKVARQQIGARIATSDECGLLEIVEASALLTMERIAWDHSARPIELGQHVYRPDRYSFEVTLVNK